MRSIGILLMVLFLGCQQKPEQRGIVIVEEELFPVDLSGIGKEKLSEYNFFVGDLKNLSPATDVVPYDLNSALFTDYAYKKRFVKIPSGSKATYNPHEVLTFPEGTVLIKNFYYPADFRKPTENIRILETRLLLLENGTWKTLPYIWNDEQTEAYLDVAGKNIDVSWIHTDGSIKNVKYSVPNMNQCKGCHLLGQQVKPIGPNARQLNKNFQYPKGIENQFVHWESLGLLAEKPDQQSIPKLAAYENENENIDARARAWLEINCAHCHRPEGPAKTSGLHLLANVSSSASLGVGKAPVAAGKGSGGLLYGIVPGKPDQSILQFRIESTHPGIMMPELGRTMVHKEGVALVRQWITQMSDE